MTSAKVIFPSQSPSGTKLKTGNALLPFTPAPAIHAGLLLFGPLPGPSKSSKGKENMRLKLIRI